MFSEAGFWECDFSVGIRSMVCSRCCVCHFQCFPGVCEGVCVFALGAVASVVRMCFFSLLHVSQ